MFKRKLIALVGIISILLLLVGCASLSSTQPHEVIHGSGPVVSRTFPMDDFSQLQLSSSFIVSFRQSQDFAVTLAMQENLFNFHEVSVQGSTLSLAATGENRTIYHITQPRAYIYAPYLTAIDVTGALHIAALDTIRAPSFSITSNGALNMVVPLAVEQLDLTLNGASTLYLSGNATHANITLNGSGHIVAGNLQTATAVVTLNGTGEVTIAVSDHLDATLEGVGDILYLGNPAVVQYIGRTARGTISRKDIPYV